MPATVTGRASLPPYSNDGKTNPITEAASITPAAKDKITLLNFSEMFLNTKPNSEPNMVAPPTPKAVIHTMCILIPPNSVKYTSLHTMFKAFNLLTFIYKKSIIIICVF